MEIAFYQIDKYVEVAYLMKTILLHGLGQSPSSWDNTLKYIEHRSDIIVLDLFDLIKGKDVNYENLFTAFSEYCLTLHEPLNLCGLSLGGILTLQFAIEYPEALCSMILIGARYNVPKTLFKIQNAIFKLMPNKSFAQMGIKKDDFINLSQSMIDIDLEKGLENIKCNTLVICGEKDKTNMRASLELKNRILNSKILIIRAAGHEVNLDSPEMLGCSINDFLNQ